MEVWLSRWKDRSGSSDKYYIQIERIHEWNNNKFGSMKLVYSRYKQLKVWFPKGYLLIIVEEKIDKYICDIWIKKFLRRKNS